MSDEVEVRQLRWRCRRGMRELDRLLERWLDRRWPEASEPERAVFRRLLTTEDDKLWRAFLGQEILDDADVQALVQRIADTSH